MASFQSHASYRSKQVLVHFSCGCNFEYQYSDSSTDIADRGAQITHDVEASCPICASEEIGIPDPMTASDMASLNATNSLNMQPFTGPVSHVLSDPFYNASPTNSFSSSISWTTAPSHNDLFTSSQAHESYLPDYALPATAYVPSGLRTVSPVPSQSSDDSNGGVLLPVPSLLAVEALSAYQGRRSLDSNVEALFTRELISLEPEASNEIELVTFDPPGDWETTDSLEDEDDSAPILDEPNSQSVPPLQSKIRQPYYEVDRPLRRLYGVNHGLPPPNASTSLIRSHSELQSPLHELRARSETRFTGSNSDTEPDGGLDSTTEVTHAEILQWVNELPTSGFESFHYRQTTVRSSPQSLRSSSPPAPPLMYCRPATPYCQHPNSIAGHSVQNGIPSLQQITESVGESCSLNGLARLLRTRADENDQGHDRVGRHLKMTDGDGEDGTTEVPAEPQAIETKAIESAADLNVKSKGSRWRLATLKNQIGRYCLSVRGDSTHDNRGEYESLSDEADLPANTNNTKAEVRKPHR